MNRFHENQNTSLLVEKFKNLKKDIEKLLRNKRATLYVMIPGQLEKTGADSRKHETNIIIQAEEGKVTATVAEYPAENLQQNFPFKYGYMYLTQIIEVLEPLKAILI